jgi:hypothetical protein
VENCSFDILSTRSFSSSGRLRNRFNGIEALQTAGLTTGICMFALLSQARNPSV